MNDFTFLTVVRFHLSYIGEFFILPEVANDFTFLTMVVPFHLSCCGEFFTFPTLVNDVTIPSGVNGFTFFCAGKWFYLSYLGKWFYHSYLGKWVHLSYNGKWFHLSYSGKLCHLSYSGKWFYFPALVTDFTFPTSVNDFTFRTGVNYFIFPTVANGFTFLLWQMILPFLQLWTESSSCMPIGQAQEYPVGLGDSRHRWLHWAFAHGFVPERRKKWWIQWNPQWKTNLMRPPWYETTLMRNHHSLKTAFSWTGTLICPRTTLF